MADVIPIHRPRVFDLDEARRLLPTLRRLTRRARDEYERLQRQLAMRAAWTPDAEAAQRRMHEVVRAWAQQVHALGCEPKGLWTIDFDNGTGYYCWQYPETDVAFFHRYDEGFAGRTPLPDALEQHP